LVCSYSDEPRIGGKQTVLAANRLYDLVITTGYGLSPRKATASISLSEELWWK
jgi:hypothetical protein